MACRGVFALSIAVTTSLLLVGCGFQSRVTYTQNEQELAHIPGIPDARFWADGARAVAIPGREPIPVRNDRTGSFTMLVLSGGGAEGAYGAGFLNGWTKAGTRPEFDVVTGTSVGALIAPFAFLGSTYDPELKGIFTDGLTDDLLRLDGLNTIIGAGIFKIEPLIALVRTYASDQLLDAIAREHRKGRRLFVVTTNIDAQRAVIWNMGAIAASSSENRSELFRSVLVASASAPGMFAPALIEAQAGGRRIREMHVDGGIMANVLALPEEMLRAAVRPQDRGKPKLFVIVNGKLAPDFSLVSNFTVPVVMRSFWTAVKANTRNILIATYDFCRRNLWEFRLTAIEPSYEIETTAVNFDGRYIGRLYEYGYARATSAAAWQGAVDSTAGRHPRPALPADRHVQSLR